MLLDHFINGSVAEAKGDYAGAISEYLESFLRTQVQQYIMLWRRIIMFWIKLHKPLNVLNNQ
jgi:hypothetical protein